MTAAVRLQEPFELDNRKIYPVVAESAVATEHGIVVSVLPLALIIEQDGDLSCALLEGESLPAIVEKLVFSVP